MRMIVSLAVLSFVVSACTSISTFRAENTLNTLKLEVGMTRSQVFDIMGVGKTTTTYFTPWAWAVPIYGWALQLITMEDVTNPSQVSRSVSQDGKSIEVLYYYTDSRSLDGAITRDETTPLVLVDGILRGWGWDYADRNAETLRIMILRGGDR